MAPENVKWERAGILKITDARITAFVLLTPLEAFALRSILQVRKQPDGRPDALPTSQAEHGKAGFETSLALRAEQFP